MIRNTNIPLFDTSGSGGTFEANANRVVKYTAHRILSAASPAVKTEGETPRASEMAT